MKTKITSYFMNPKRGSLKNKLLCVYFLLVALPLGFFTIYTYIRVHNVIQKQTFTAAQNAFNDTVMSIRQTFGKLDEVLDILVMDPLVYSMASNDPNDYSYIRRLEDSNMLALTLEHLRNLSGLKRIRLYVDNDYLYSSGQNNVIQLREVASSSWYATLSGQNERVWFAPPDFADQLPEEQFWFSSMQVIFNPRNVNEPLAVLRADLDAAQIIRLAENTSITKNGILLLLRKNEILHCSAQNESSNVLNTLVENLPESDTGSWTMLQIEKKNYYVQCIALSDAGWKMAAILPHDDVFYLSHELRFEMLIIVMLVSITAYLLAVAISKSALERISLLASTMQTVESEDVTIRPAPSGNDEITQLIRSFNHMMNHIDHLMEEKVLYGQQIKSLELKALQAQINPHFLYNSLDLINCTAISHNVPQISRMVKSLGQFYRLSLSGGNECIPLSEEFRHAQLYVDIQNMRFENCVQTLWHLDASAAGCLIIKIVLQPLIENAIIHGILEKPSKCGRLCVCARRNKDIITITIEDDGMGMDENTVKANFTPTPVNDISESSGGYGVHNVCDRLRIAYGWEPYGLFCESIPSEKTLVRMVIPAVDPA